jgi:hypothetical protein
MGMSQSREMKNFNLFHACNRSLESLKPKNSDNTQGFETGYWGKRYEKVAQNDTNFWLLHLFKKLQ